MPVLVSFGRRRRRRRRSASHKRTRSSRGWRAPTSTVARRRMQKKYGKRCFMRPTRSNRRGRPKYPVCNRSGRLSCKGLLAAHQRGSRKARRVAKRAGCVWAQGSRRRRRRRSGSRPRRRRRRRSRRRY